MSFITTHDRFPGPRERWAYLRSRVAERRYARQLRALAKHIGDLAKGLHAQPDELARLLDQYAELIRPWARSVATTMVAEVAKRDAQGWFDAARQVGEGLRQTLASPDLGATYAQLRADQVQLITSLPAEAAERVRRLTAEALVIGGRSSTLAAELQRTGQVARGRANLIARTETAKASSTLTMLRAQAAGCVAYIWRTAADEDVRPTHKKMDGKLVMFDKPPIIDGRPVHAGMDFNCRCYMEPVL